MVMKGKNHLHIYEYNLALNYLDLLQPIVLVLVDEEAKKCTG